MGFGTNGQFPRCAVRPEQCRLVYFDLDLCFQSIKTPTPSIYLSLFDLEPHFMLVLVNISWAWVKLLQSAGTSMIRKGEPHWPIQQPPSAVLQLKMNSWNPGEETCRAGSFPTGIRWPEHGLNLSVCYQTRETTSCIVQNGVGLFPTPGRLFNISTTDCDSGKPI